MPKTKPSSLDTPRPWHRLFGLLLSDYLTDSPFSVELEMDLSHRKQLLDVIVVRKSVGNLQVAMPDGMDDLLDHNLISFKSFQETLDDWTLKELTGHYVNYRKQISPKDAWVAEDAIRMYAVCARYPRELMSQVENHELQPGVFECKRGTDRIRVIVANQLQQEVKNALIHLFSATRQQIEYGIEHYRFQSERTSTLVSSIFNQYRQEGQNMPYTMEDFRRDFLNENYTLEERLAGLNPRQILNSIPMSQILDTIPKRQIEEYLKKAKTKKKPASSRRKKTRK